MATHEVKLPPGFELDEALAGAPAPGPAPAAPTLPPDFEVDPPAPSAMGRMVKSVTTNDVTPPKLPEGIPAKVASYLQRLFKGTVETGMAPLGMEMKDGKLSTISKETAGRVLAPTPGKAGVSRVFEEEGKRLGGAVRGVGKNVSEAIADSGSGAPAHPEIQNPVLYAIMNGVLRPEDQARVAPFKAGVAAAAAAPFDMMSDSLTPSAMAQNVGAEGVGMAASAAGPLVSRLASRGATKLSGLDPELARMAGAHPEVMGPGVEGSRESTAAAVAAIQDIVEKAKAGHIDALTAKREISRLSELGDVEKAVGGVQDVIRDARKNAGANLEAAQKEIGIHKTLEEKAADIASGAAGKPLSAPEVVRQTLGALDPSAPKGRESVGRLVELRRAIDNLVDFSNKGIQPVGGETEAVLKQLRGKINDRLGGVTETPFEKSAMGVESTVKGDTENIGAPLRAAERQFSQAATAFDTLKPKFETVPKGIATIRSQVKGGLRSVDPELAALEGLEGGKDALAAAEGAVGRHAAGEEAFNEGLKTFDPLESKFSTTPKGLSTVETQVRGGLNSVDPEIDRLTGLPGGKDALNKAKSEVSRFLIETAPPREGGGTPAFVAQTLGLTPKRAAQFIADHSPEAAARFPAISKAATALRSAAARGPQALSTTHYLLQQQDPEYRATLNALQQDGEQ